MFFRLFLTDLKRIKQRFLPLVLITLILAVGLSVVVLLSNRLLYNEQTIEPVNVGLVADASSPYAKMAYSMVSEMDSYRATCHFIEIASEDHGRQMLANDQIKALIIIPDNIINSIIYGEDNPITVIYNQDGTLETYTLNEVFKSTSSMLATAQAATTIIYQGAYQMGLPDTALDQIATDADNLYMDYVLSRTELYIREDLQLTGAYTPYQYYIVSGLLLLLFFSGIVFLSFIKGNSDTLRLRLKLHGITGAHIIISQYLTLTITLFMIYTILFFSCMTGGTIGHFAPLQFHISGFFAGIPAILFIGFVILLIGYLPTGYSGACLLLFLTAFLLAYIGGGIVPVRLLPDFIQNFAEHTPYYQLLNHLCNDFYH